MLPFLLRSLSLNHLFSPQMPLALVCISDTGRRNLNVLSVRCATVGNRFSHLLALVVESRRAWDVSLTASELSWFYLCFTLEILELLGEGVVLQMSICLGLCMVASFAVWIPGFSFFS